MSVDDPFAALLRELEEARQRLEAAAEDPEAARAILGEVNDLAQRLAAEVDRTRSGVREARDAEHDG